MPPAMRCSLVIPARNEGGRVEPTLRAYRSGLGSDVELLVVANDCSDDTAEIARRVADELGGIRVLEIRESVGKGGAVRAGWRMAEGDLVGFADADLATPPESVRRVLEAAARSGAAIGSRWLPESRVVGRTPERDAAGHVFAKLVRALTALPFRDTQCGIKVFHRRFLPDVLRAARIHDLAFDVELLLLLRDQGAAIEEVPIAWTAQPGSAALGTLPGLAAHGLRMTRSILGLWWRRRSPQRQSAEDREQP
jgi:glycosyltransferase involved in cell wall biosynthesis